MITGFCLIACQRRDTFYTRRVGFDYIRIPLIKPYEAVLLNGQKEWIMNLRNEGPTSSVINIKQIGVGNRVIVLHSENSNLNGTKVNEAWFVIIPTRHIEQGFETRAEFVKFLKEQGIAVEPKTYDINMVSTYFIDHTPINWDFIK